MKGITGVICNRKAEVQYLISDEGYLFAENKSFSNEGISLFDIVDEGSHEKLEGFLESTQDDRTAINWEINILIRGRTRMVYFCGLYWMEKFFVQISERSVDHFFFPYQAASSQISSADMVRAGDLSTEKLNEISRLNNELIDIQRELTKKNRQLERLNARLEKLATTDSLTGILNRRAVLNRAKTELERARREGRVFSLAILDLDNFKHINDSFGHQTGDKALMLFAESLQESTREYDGAGRFGGDEFLVYFSVDDDQQFTNILKRLQDQINQITIDVSEKRIGLTASIGGVVLHPGKGSEAALEDLISEADKMLYQAKAKEDQSICISQYESIN